MRRLICTVSFGLALAAASAGWAQTPAAPAASAAAPPAPAGLIAEPEPLPGDSNAQRAKSQPGNNAPMWRAVKETGGTSTLPGAEKGVLVQPFVQYPGSRFTNAGEAWRQVRNQWLIPYGGALLFIVALAIALFYWRKGPLGHAPNTGSTIERFTPFERAAHWSNAIAFVVLALSGLVMAFGKFLLLPLIGSTLFGWLTYALKTAHNLVGPLFAVSLVVVLLTFVRDNLPQRGDLTWLRRGGGLMSDREVPSNRFNAGEKLVFWGGVLLLGGIVVASGLVMDQLLPGLGYLRGDMHIAHMVHASAAVLMMAMFCGHIYIGTIGMRGAYRAMREGHVDEAWAAEHHALWLADIRAGKIPAQRSAPSARPHTARPA
ncbi:formate dehydrogenase subunit gamma [Ideonella sp.]|uniref:formate dehydrogenase subunit gamma n=1 Tax=Ideonella sp. TaxID=1929293 RepID=UPI0035B2B606